MTVGTTKFYVLCAMATGEMMVLKVKASSKVEATRTAHEDYAVEYVERHLTETEVKQYRQLIMRGKL